MSYAENKPIIIGVAGPTGSGKTTLVEGLSELFGLDRQLEKPEDNPFLDDFYEQLNRREIPAPSAFASQTWYLEQSYKQAVSLAGGESERPVLLDVPMEGDFMYAFLQNKANILTDAEFELYCQLYDALYEKAPQPDLLVVTLVNDVNRLHKRILDRGRSNEVNVPVEYWGSQILYWQEKLRQDMEGRLMQADSGRLNWLTDEGAVAVAAQIAIQLPSWAEQLGL